MSSRDVVPFPRGWDDADAEDETARDDEVITGEAVALDLRPAGFALRAGGAAIDAAIYLGGFVAILSIVSTALAAARVEDAVISILLVVSLVTCLVVAPIAVETATRGRSVGKIAVGARIVRDDGAAIGIRHAIIRGLAGVLEVYLTLGGVAIIVGLVTPRSKRLGDLMAGTYSQYERVSRRLPAPILLPWGLEGWASVADVARMPEGLARRVAQFLHEAVEYEPTRRAGIAAGLAADVAPYVSPLPDVPPEILLAAVTAVRREREARALALEAQRLEALEALAPQLAALPHDFPAR